MAHRTSSLMLRRGTYNIVRRAGTSNQDRDMVTLRNISLLKFIVYVKSAMDPAIEAEFKKMNEKFTLMELAQSQPKQKQPTVYIKSERKLTSLIAKNEGCDMKTMDKVVTDKFIDGIMDSQIKREVRRFAFENPKLPFIEFKQRMLQWVDDTPSVQVNKVSTETPLSEDLLELVKCQQNMLEHQQKQIDMLMSMTKQKPNYSPRYRDHNYRGYSIRRGYHKSGRGYYNRGKEEGPMNHPKGTPSQWGV
uniref:Uncharacterized protein n=1 Tax=Magallana gigas TaxID=29159 RepID=A0A8W8HTE8_MAGGI